MAPAVSFVLLLGSFTALQAVQDEPWGLRPEMCIPDARTREAVFGVLYNVVVVSPAGEIFVSRDTGVPVLRFSPHGAFQGTVGTAGRGPGEFQTALPIGLRSDSLWVYDPYQQRLSLFGPDGTFVRIVAGPEDLAPFGSRFRVHGLLEDGRVLGGFTYQSGRIGSRGMLPIIAIHPDSRPEQSGLPPHDTITSVYSHDVRTPMTFPNGMSVITGAVPDQSSLWALDPHGRQLVIVDQPPATGISPDTIILRRISVSTLETTTRRIPITPVMLRGEVKRAVIERIARALSSDMPDVSHPQVVRSARESIPLPDQLPPVTALLVGADGSVWLRREMLHPGPVRWDVLRSPDGAIQAVHIDERVSLDFVSSTHVWGIRRDSLDVPSLCRFRVSREIRGRSGA